MASVFRLAHLTQPLLPSPFGPPPSFDFVTLLSFMAPSCQVCALVENRQLEEGHGQAVPRDPLPEAQAIDEPTALSQTVLAFWAGKAREKKSLLLLYRARASCRQCERGVQGRGKRRSDRFCALRRVAVRTVEGAAARRNVS